jgi:hypothetical protein
MEIRPIRTGKDHQAVLAEIDAGARRGAPEALQIESGTRTIDMRGLRKVGTRLSLCTAGNRRGTPCWCRRAAIKSVSDTLLSVEIAGVTPL